MCVISPFSIDQFLCDRMTIGRQESYSGMILVFVKSFLIGYVFLFMFRYYSYSLLLLLMWFVAVTIVCFSNDVWWWCYDSSNQLWFSLLIRYQYVYGVVVIDTMQLSLLLCRYSRYQSHKNSINVCDNDIFNHSVSDWIDSCVQ